MSVAVFQTVNGALFNPDIGSRMRQTLATTSFSHLQLLLPGILMSGTVAAASTFISEHYGAPVMLMALLIGMALHFLHEETKCAAGIDFTASSMLRVGVALLGARITVDEISSLGATPALIVVGCVGATILFGVLVARLASRPAQFGILTGGSVAICGASAALAISCVLSKTSLRQQDTMLTVVAVTTLSTLAMIVYPIWFSVLGFSEQETGFLIGATIHDVAQVAGAGYAVSQETGDLAIITKLLRVSLLPVVVFILTISLLNGRERGSGATFPWFVIAFAVLVLVNSLGLIPQDVAQLLRDLSKWLLVFSIAAIGMKTSLQATMGVARMSFFLIVMETLFLMTIATVAAKLFL